MNFLLSVCDLLRLDARNRRAVCTLALLACAAVAKASPVTYTLTGVFSGSLAGTQFTDTPATFTMALSDTSAVTTTDNAFFFNTTGVKSFQLGSMTPVLFLSPTFGVESEYGAASFLDTASSFSAAEYNEMTPYNVLTVAGTTSGMFLSYGPYSELTSGGDLIITGATGDVTFQTVTSAPQPTPEPAGFWLAATGAIGIASRLSPRRRSA